MMEDRRFEIEAAVMRILKERKVLQHNELVKSLIERLKFPVEISHIKQRVESLIEKDYIKRSPSDNSVYEYIA